MRLTTYYATKVQANGGAIVLCSLLLLGASGISAVSAQRQTAVTSGAPPALGLPPRDCGSSPPPYTISPYFGRAVGSAPGWAISSFTHGLALHVGNPKYNTYGKYGWEVKVLWVVQPGYLHHVTLRGGNLRTHAPLWFQIGISTPSTAPTLNPRKPGIPVEHGNWREFPSYLMIPRSGCYFLQATWPGGSWRRVFGAGR